MLPTMTDADRLIAELRGRREALRVLVAPIWRDTKECTAALIRAVYDLAVAHNATVELEARHDVPGNPRKGRIDLIAKMPDGSRLAVEVDRAYKRWSLVKLISLQQKEPNTRGLWLRWDNHHGGDWIQGVAVVGLPDTTAQRLAAARLRYSLPGQS